MIELHGRFSFEGVAPIGTTLIPVVGSDYVGLCANARARMIADLGKSGSPDEDAWN